jgi:hypothetical protein
MTRSLFFIGGLVALCLIFVAQTVVLVAAPRSSGAATQAAAAPAADPAAADATLVAIDDLAAWPAVAGR